MRRLWILLTLISCALASATVGASAASAGILTVSPVGNGTGTVVSDPVGIDCSNVPGTTHTTCSHDYGSAVFTGATLTARPSEDSGFVSWSGTGGGTCTGNTNPCVTGSLLVDHAAIATFAPKPEAPAVTTGSASNVEFPSATVSGTVNPGSDDFAVTECYFEYGPTTDYGERATCHPGSIGPGTSSVSVSASIGVLDSRRIYHYRLVAANDGGVNRGMDQTLVGGVAPADNCPNAAIRAEQGAIAQRLPSCGAYELVSPRFSAGQGVSLDVGTADGDHVTLRSAGSFADAENSTELGLQYTAERTASGWKTTAIAPPASAFPFLGFSGVLDWTRDGSRSLWLANLKADEGTNRFTPVVRDPDGSFHVAGPTQNTIDGEYPGGTSADLMTVVLRTTTRPTLADGTVDSRSASMRSLYLSTRDSDGQLSLRQVAYRQGSTMSPACNIELGGVSTFGSSSAGRNSISSDGNKVFFMPAGQGTCGAAASRRVWAKVGVDDPIELSASQCAASCGAVAAAYFRGASRDGSRVYFTTQQRLLLEDQDTSSKNDLYEYDFNATGQKLRLVTGSAAPAGAAVATGGPFRLSDDGAYVYFVATGRALAGPNARGVAPQPGANNLYVYHRATGESDGTTTFVGALGSTYGTSPHLSETGRYLLFQTTADLTGERASGDIQPDLYRYDARDDHLQRVWTTDPAHNGTSRVDGAAIADLLEAVGGVPSAGSQRLSGWNASLQISADGSLVGFNTKEPLSRDDHNGVTDGYLWEAATGRLTMLTDGTSRPANRFVGAGFLGMSPSGDSLFLQSASPMLREHTSGQNAAYAIRRDGGFPAPPAPGEPCVPGNGCQPEGPPAPELNGPAGSSTLDGPGNVRIAPPEQTPSLRVSAVKPVRGTQTKVTVRVSGKGRLRVSGPGLAPSSKSTNKAGSYRVPVTLSKSGRSTLHRNNRLKIRVTVTFVPEKGKPIVKRVSVVFTSKAKKRVATRSTREPNVLSLNVHKGR